jgi:anti-sigma factor RsiW
MNDPLQPGEIELTRWIDNELSPEEAQTLERRLAQDPALAAEAEAARCSAQKLGLLLRTHVPLAMEPPSAEFMRRQILREIEPPVTGKPARRQEERSSWFERFLRPWLAPIGLAGASALAVFLMLKPGLRPEAQSAQTRVLSAWSPEMQSAPAAFFSPEAEAQVIDLEGLTAYPAERTVAGHELPSATSVAILAP